MALIHIQTPWTYTFLRQNETAEMFKWGVEGSPDLVTWTPMPESVEGASIEELPAANDFQAVTVRIPLGSGPRFLRLKLTPRVP